MTQGLIAIDEEAKLYLTQWGHGHDQRFADLFRKAWQRLPATTRSLLTRYWEHQGHAHGLVCGDSHPAGPYRSSPRIELVSGWQDRDVIVPSEDPNWGPGSAGEVFACGYLLRFRASCIDWMSPESVQDVVALQLAHCWQYADSILNGVRRWWDPATLETEAVAVAKSWGFNPESAGQVFTLDKRAMAW